MSKIPKQTLPPRSLFNDGEAECPELNTSIISASAGDAGLKQKSASSSHRLKEPVMLKPGSFDRNAYQREYMKKRRAELKAQKEK